MNIIQLRAFHAVSSTGSFTAAARKLHVSQPAVTMHVRALEQAYGVDLFYRRGRRVERTPLGDELAERARRLFAIEDEAEELLRGTQALDRGSIHIGADAPFHVIGCVARFRERYPGVTISLALGNARRVLADLLDCRTDVAVVAEPPEDPDLYAVPWKRHRLVVIVARAHPLGRHLRIPLAKLEGEPMIVREAESTTQRTFDAALERQRVKPRVVMEMQSREAVHEAVAAGLGASVISEAELGEDARITKLVVSDVKLENTEHLVCLAARRSLRAVEAFFAIANEIHGLPRAR